MEEPSISIGWIGLGHAGYPLASSLASHGHRLLVLDLDPTLPILFLEQHPTSRVATSDPDSFSNCDLIITSLPDGKVVSEVLLGEHGIAPHLKPGAVVVDTSSSSPFETRALGLELSRLRVGLVDAPVTQEGLGAIGRGEATFMVGCDDEEVLGKVLPVLRGMGKKVFPMGGLGAGHTMKTLNNYVSVGSIIALNDALVTGQKLGLDPQTMIDVMNAGTGVNFSTKQSQKNLKSYDTGYSLELLVKDVKIAKDVIEKSGFETELPALAERYLEDSLKVVKKGADHAESLKSWEQRAGVEIKKTERQKDELESVQQ